MVKTVLCWYFGYAISSNLTFFAYMHMGGYYGGGDAYIVRVVKN